MHVISTIFVLYPLHSDIRKKTINIYPAVVLIAMGAVLHAVSGTMYGLEIWAGGFLGILSALIGNVTGGGIGAGDSVMIGGLGFLEGVWFCMKAVGISITVLLIYGIINLCMKNISLKSRISYTPFLAIGYIGARFL